MINYILQIVLFQVLFLAIYDFFLSKETFFNKNRWYLLSTPILSFLLPFIKIPTFQKAVPQELIIYLPEIVLSPEKVIQKASWYQSINYIDVLFWLGVLFFTTLFFTKLFKIANLIRKYEVVKKKSYTLILLPNETKAFSFFNYIFLGKDIPDSQKVQIIEHELVHSKQRHSLDLLLFEFLKIVMWFNPMIFLYQKRITLVHEYISDEIATKSAPKENYINNLLSNFFQVENIAFVNQFYKHTFIKKRIIMMTKNKSKKMNQLKYLVLIPVLASMLFYTSCSETESSVDTLSKKEVETMFRIKDGKLVGEAGGKETYLDSYLGVDSPIGAIEIGIKELSSLERNEFESLNFRFQEKIKESKYSDMFKFKFYKMPNGRNASAMVFDIEKYKEKVKNEILENGDKIRNNSEEVSFMKIDRAPTFPGCESGDKKCFSKMVQKHFSREFDAKLPNTLGLEAGRKRVFIGFKIDKEGNVIDVNARAPHQKIKEEVIKVMSSLPKMIPGENNGEVVSVNYSIPFTLVIE